MTFVSRRFVSGSIARGEFKSVSRSHGMHYFDSVIVAFFFLFWFVSDVDRCMTGLNATSGCDRGGA